VLRKGKKCGVTIVRSLKPRCVMGVMITAKDCAVRRATLTQPTHTHTLARYTLCSLTKQSGNRRTHLLIKHKTLPGPSHQHISHKPLVRRKTPQQDYHRPSTPRYHHKHQSQHRQHRRRNKKQATALLAQSTVATTTTAFLLLGGLPRARARRRLLKFRTGAG
jgi:hypothetical protein